MKKHYFLPLSMAICSLLISLLLQNCGGSTNLPIEGEPTEVQLAIIGGEAEQAATSLPVLMPELWQYIFSYLDFENILLTRAANSDWNELITGYRQVGVVGVENRPSHIIDTRAWIRRKEVNFEHKKASSLRPATIPSFYFYFLMGKVSNLPPDFCPYLQGTKIHMLRLGLNKMGDAGAIELAKYLQGSKVHKLDLSHSYFIGAVGAEALAQVLG
jgi:hypothetical protein